MEKQILNRFSPKTHNLPICKGAILKIRDDLYLGQVFKDENDKNLRTFTVDAICLQYIGQYVMVQSATWEDYAVSVYLNPDVPECSKIHTFQLGMFDKDLYQNTFTLTIKNKGDLSVAKVKVFNADFDEMIEYLEEFYPDNYIYELIYADFVGSIVKEFLAESITELKNDLEKNIEGL